MTYHNTHQYLLSPEHPVTVAVIGAGGTGSQVMQALGRMNYALIALGHPGLIVTCYDGDIITESNVGRQLFSNADIGSNKAAVITTRINRFFGTDWRSYSKNYDASLIKEDIHFHNIFISCLDTANARVVLGKEFSKKIKVHLQSIDPYKKPFYWMDFGNNQQSGQFILGSFIDINLPFVTDCIDFSKIKDKDSGPSCSLAAALNKQDLFINSALVQFGMSLLWKLFREARIGYRGCYLNLNTMCVNPIKI